VTCHLLILLIVEWSICYHNGLLVLTLLATVDTHCRSFVTALGINLCDLRVSAGFHPQEKVAHRDHKVDALRWAEYVEDDVKWVPGKSVQ
jgi:hypothetical protein